MCKPTLITSSEGGAGAGHHTCKMETFFMPLALSRTMPFHDFTLFVVLSLFTTGSPNADIKYSACVGGIISKK